MKKLFTLLAFALAVNISIAQTPLTTAVDFTVTDIHGETHNLFEILDGGQYVLLDMFAYWCGPCCEIAPDLKQVYEDYGCNTSQLFVISVEADGTIAQTEAFENNCGASGGQPTASGMDADGNLTNGNPVIGAYGVGAFPTIILIAPDRTIISQDIWPFSYDIASTLLTQNQIEVAECGVQSSNNNLEKLSAINAYPNPADAFTNLEFNLASKGQVNVEIVDITGKTIQTAHNGVLVAGQQMININTSNFSTGTYLIKISVEGEVAETLKFNKI